MISDSESPSSETPPQAVKRCFRCKQEKPCSEFYVKSKKTGLLHHMCKVCCIEREKQRVEKGVAWGCKPENKEKRKANWRAAYHANPEKFRGIALEVYYRRQPAATALKRERYQENPAKEIARVTKYRQENPEVGQAWLEANRLRVRECIKRWNKANPEAARISRGARRARRVAAKCEPIKSGYHQRLLVQQNFLCPYCRVDLRNVIQNEDHVIPLALGGEHSERNLQITCKPCNLRKHAKHPLDFAAEMGIVKDPTLIPI